MTYLLLSFRQLLNEPSLLKTSSQSQFPQFSICLLLYLHLHSALLFILSSSTSYSHSPPPLLPPLPLPHPTPPTLISHDIISIPIFSWALTSKVSPWRTKGRPSRYLIETFSKVIDGSFGHEEVNFLEGDVEEEGGLSST